MITADEVRERMAATKKTWFPVRSCSICGVPIGYHLSPDSATIGFQSSCGCVSYTAIRPASFQEVADLINRNWVFPAARKRLLGVFGFPDEVEL